MGGWGGVDYCNISDVAAIVTEICLPYKPYTIILSVKYAMLLPNLGFLRFSTMSVFLHFCMMKDQ